MEFRPGASQRSDHSGEVKEPIAQCNLGEKETVFGLLDGHILEVGGKGERGVRLNHGDGILQESDAISGVDAHADLSLEIRCMIPSRSGTRQSLWFSIAKRIRYFRTDRLRSRD